MGIAGAAVKALAPREKKKQGNRRPRQQNRETEPESRQREIVPHSTSGPDEFKKRVRHGDRPEPGQRAVPGLMEKTGVEERFLDEKAEADAAGHKQSNGRWVRRIQGLSHSVGNPRPSGMESHEQTHHNGQRHEGEKYGRKIERQGQALVSRIGQNHREFMCTPKEDHCAIVVPSET